MERNVVSRIIPQSQDFGPLAASRVRSRKQGWADGHVDPAGFGQKSAILQKAPSASHRNGDDGPPGLNRRPERPKLKWAYTRLRRERALGEDEHRFASKQSLLHLLRLA